MSPSSRCAPAPAIVTQDTFLFHASVLENLRYGKPSATRTEVEAAARRAPDSRGHAALPAATTRSSGERGYQFPGGERQRLAIARAILKDPRILILDEATSSLDADSELVVQQALTRLRQGRTTLVIAHRLSTIVDADSIVVFDRGRIVERGTHKSLLAQSGLYAWLWRLHSRTAEAPDRLNRTRARPGAEAESMAQAGSPFLNTPWIAPTNVSISSSGV
jgi:ATP-binding cassette subfamily B protein